MVQNTTDWVSRARGAPDGASAAGGTGGIVSSRNATVMRHFSQRRRLSRSALLFSLTLSSACSTLENFEGSYRGVVVGSDDPGCIPPEPCSFIRRGFPEAMVLRLDAFVPPPDPRSPGRLTTEGYEAFSGTLMEAIDPLENDQLSLYDFPGADRVRNYIFAIRPSAGVLAGRDGLVFLSLLNEGEVELRIIVGKGDIAAGDHFGLFRLERQ